MQQPLYRTCAVAVYLVGATKIRVVYNKSMAGYCTLVLYFHLPAARKNTARKNTAAHSCNIQPCCLLTHQIKYTYTSHQLDSYADAFTIAYIHITITKPGICIMSGSPRVMQDGATIPYE